MAFHEGVHAFLIGSYYELLHTRFAEQGDRAFVLATRTYGFERGTRMAQRAIRLGLPLDHHSFMQLNEMIASGLVHGNEKTVEALSPEYVVRITKCPWYDQFVAMGCCDGGSLYCANIDEAVCRGFAPEIGFQCNGSLNNGSCCIHIVRGTTYREPPMVQLLTEYAPGHAYHCGHLYWTFRRTFLNIFGKTGTELAEAVAARFETVYGAEMLRVLLSFEETDFLSCQGDAR